MRYFMIEQVKEGMKLGKTLYTANGEVLLRRGIELTNDYIQKIKLLAFTGVYIDDKESEEIAIPEPITEELKLETTRVLRNIFNLDEKRLKSLEMLSYCNQMRTCVQHMMEQILFDSRQVLSLLDVKIYDDVIYTHSINTAILSIVIAETMKYNMREIEEIAVAAIFHDIGKRFLPKELFEKSAKFKPEELREYQNHAKLGYNFLKNYVDMSSLAYIAVLQHHEKYNGAGYPEHKKQDEINKYAKIISVANAYDGLISQKTKHHLLLSSKAYESIIRNMNITYAPEVVRAFAVNVAIYPVGVTVKLSNGKTGIVAKNYKESPLRPVLRVIGEGYFKRFLDLKNDIDAKNITITGIDL